MYHGHRYMGGQGDMPPLLFEVEGTSCVLSPLLFGGGLFCNAQLHNTDYIHCSFNHLHDVKQCKACKLICTLLIWMLTGIEKTCLIPCHTPTMH